MRSHSPPRRISAADEEMRTLVDLAIERIYAAAGGDIPWKEALAAVTRSLGAERAILYTPELTEAAGGIWASHDVVRRPRALRVVDAEPAAGAPEKVFSTVLADGGDPAMPTTLFALFEPAHAHAGATHQDAFGVLARHMAVAARLWFRQRASKHGAETLAATLNAAVLIADREGRVAWMNPQANDWRRDGRLAVVKGRVAVVADLPIDVPRLIRDACDGASSIEWSGDGRITLQVVPVQMPCAELDAGACALLLLRDRNGGRHVVAELARKFDLTPSETELAIALSKGILVAEYAAHRSVAMSTVRTQLKSLLAKTASRRQSDVVALVARMQPIVGSPSSAAASDLAGARPRAEDAPPRRDTSNG